MRSWGIYHNSGRDRCQRLGCFHFGLAKTFGAKYGTISISVALVIVVINFMLKEQIGLGMILDALIVGKTVDFLNYVNPIPRQENLMFGVILMLAGIFILGFFSIYT